MSSSDKLQQVSDKCVCNTMSGRVSELKHQKIRKQKLYDEITSKFGKNNDVQACLFGLFKDKLDEQTDFNSLEAIVKKKLAKSKATPKNNSSEKPMFRQTLQSLHKHKTLDALPEKEENIWATIVKKDTERFYQEEKDRTARETDVKSKIKKELDKQVQEKQKKFIEELKFNQFYDSKVSEFTKTQESREMNFSTMLKNRLVKEKQMQDEFLKETQRKREEKLLSDKQYEKNLVNKIKQDIASEIQASKLKKMKERKNYLQIINENEEKRKKEIELKQKEQEEDVLCMKQYALMLERQEQDRINNARRIEDRFQKVTNVYAHSAIQHENSKRLQEDSDLYNNIMFQEAMDRVREEQEWKKKQEIQRKLKEEYENQIINRSSKLANEIKSEKEFANAFKKDYEDYKKYQEKRKRDEKELNLKYVDYLKGQMHQKMH